MTYCLLFGTRQMSGGIGHENQRNKERQTGGQEDRKEGRSIKRPDQTKSRRERVYAI